MVTAHQEVGNNPVDRIYVNQIGPDQEAFFDFYAKEVLPRLR